MSKPKLIIEIEKRTTKDEVLEIIKEYLNELFNNDTLCTIGEVELMISNHNHDDIYAEKDELSKLLYIVNNNDYGGLYSESDIEVRVTENDLYRISNDGCYREI